MLVLSTLTIAIETGRPSHETLLNPTLSSYIDLLIVAKITINSSPDAAIKPVKMPDQLMHQNLSPRITTHQTLLNYRFDSFPNTSTASEDWWSLAYELTSAFCHLTPSGDQQKRSFVLTPESNETSSFSNSNSKTLEFSTIRSFVTDFGITTARERNVYSRT